MSNDIDPKYVEQQRREDRYREIATILDRGQKLPTDAAAAVQELLQEMWRLFVSWPVDLADKVHAASDQKALKALAKVCQTQHVLDFSLGYVRWKEGLSDRYCLRGYVLRRWPMLWKRIEAVWQAYCLAMSPGDLYQFLESRPKKEQLDDLSHQAVMLDGWIRQFEAVIQRYGLKTTDSSEEIASADATPEHAMSETQRVERVHVPIIIALGECCYRIAGHEPVKVTEREDILLRSFLDRSPLSKPELAKAAGMSAEDAVSVLRSLKGTTTRKAKYDTMFAPAIRMAGKRGSGGYHVSIRTDS